MSIRPRTSSRGVTTYAVLFRHAGRQRSETFPTEAAAIKFDRLVQRSGPDAALRILDHRQGVVDASVLTVAQQLDRHIAALTHVTDGAIANYRTYADKIREDDLGVIPLDALTRDDVAAWIGRWDRAGRSAKTTRNYQSLLSAALARAVDDGALTTNVAARHKIKRTVKRATRFLTYAEFGAIRDAAPEHYRPFLTFLVATGLRFSEATALQIHGVSLDAQPDPTVTVTRAWKRGGGYGPPKSKKSARTISLDASTAALIAPLTVGRSPDDLLFVNLAGARIQQSTMYQSWIGWVRKAGVAHSTMHACRHTHASWMLAQGMSIFDLQHRLGHESIKTTGDVYGHLLPERSAVAARAAGLAMSMVPSAPLELTAS